MSSEDDGGKANFKRTASSMKSSSEKNVKSARTTGENDSLFEINESEPNTIIQKTADEKIQYENEAEPKERRHTSSISDDEQEPCCVICMDATAEMLPQHNCATCKPDAWRICADCDYSVRSRLCPVCQSSYKEHIFYAISDFPVLSISYANNRESALASTKLQFLLKLVAEQNTLVWCNVSKRMLFSMPVDALVDISERKFLMTSIPMDESRIMEGDNVYTFKFTSNIWDELEAENEKDDADEDMAKEGDLKAAIKFILNPLKTEGSKVFLLGNPEDWDNAIASFTALYDEQFPQNIRSSNDTSS